MPPRRWKNSEILEAILIGLEQGHEWEWAPQLSDNIISEVSLEGGTPKLLLALANGQEFDITCKRVPGPNAAKEPDLPAAEPEKEKELVKHTVLVRSEHLASICEILTGYGEILGIDHEGTISYSIEGDDLFELGLLAGGIQSELRSYDVGAEIVAKETKPS